MKFFKYILFLLLIAVIGLSIYIAVQPNSYKVTRTRAIKAPIVVLYDNVIDLKNWEAWSPWVEKEPSTIITLSEQTHGVGGSYSWEDKDGKGTLKTTEAVLNTSIKHEMQFAEFPASDISWNFKSNADGTTNVTWNISGKDLTFGFKAYTAFSGSMDKHVGPDFERGLEKLDSVIVSSMQQYGIQVDGVKEYGGGFYMYKTTSANASNISNTMGKQYGEIMGYMAKNNIVANGMPFTIYEDMNLTNGNVIMSQAIPIQNKVDLNDDSNILCGYIPKTKVLKTTLKGNYTNLGQAWEVTMKYLADNNLEQSDLKPFEIYITDPGLVPNPANWITEIYVPIKE